MVARVLQERLQKVADELPESQCGFRRERSCADMIFTVQQLGGEGLGAYKFSVDLKKAYDSVPRDAMWVALGKLGVPVVSELTVQLISSFHQDMRARVRLDGVVLEEISVQNGPRQGCCLYTCLAVERWRLE